jgi:glutamate racemase
MTFGFDQRPIGIFDSGVGGLTVARALKQLLPNEEFVYLADTASRPFGTKSKEELNDIIKKNIEIFRSYNIKLLVIACHTACSAGMEQFQSINVPVLGISASSFRCLDQVDQKKAILVLGTERTIGSKIYENYINGQKVAFFKACTIIERMIEEIYQDHDIIQKEISALLSPYQQIKDLVVFLGCTHFPIYSTYIKNALDRSSILVDPAEEFSSSIYKHLLLSQSLRNLQTKQDLYLVTKDPQIFEKKFHLYFKDNLAKSAPFFIQPCAMI